MSGAPPVFNIRPPEGRPLPLVVSIPHAGTYVPPEVAAGLADKVGRTLPMTDWHLHHLYDFLPSLGVTTIYANVSRLVVDLNRAPDAAALYPGRFETGLVPERDFQGAPLCLEPPDAGEIRRRVQTYHRPYHDKLAGLLAQARQSAGAAWLVDAHSVASAASLLHPTLERDIYLGDRDGLTSGPWMADTVERAFRDAGFGVVRNSPFKGGYITDHYGRMPDTFALQIEMCQRLYMEEGNPAMARGLPRFVDMQRVLHEVFASLVRALSGRL